jgi:2-dehydropantoate 2-reductase
VSALENPNVLVFGAGAVGATVGGWLAERHDRVWLLDMPPTVETLGARGLVLYLGGEKDRASTIRVKAVSDLAAAPRPDLLILAVKTYSLEKVAAIVKEKLAAPLPIVLALQNGVDNQTILPPHFPRVVYGIVGYNAWIDEPGVVGYQKKGPLVLGTPQNELGPETRAIAALLGRGVETIVTDRLADAAWSKMIINLTNSLQALIGHPMRPVTDRSLFQRILTNLTYEGVLIASAAGRRECRIGGMPSWRLMWAAAKLPQLLTRRAFEKNVAKMVISSMAQDVLQRGGTDNELETLNGRFIRLADEHGLAVPYNRAVYALCKARFGKPGFAPVGLEDVWAEVRRQGAAGAGVR